MPWAIALFAAGVAVILAVEAADFSKLLGWIIGGGLVTCGIAYGIAHHPKVSPFWGKNIKINVGDAHRVVNYSDDSQRIQNETVLVEIENLADYALSNVCLEIVNIIPFQENFGRLNLSKAIKLSPRGNDHSKIRSHVAHLRDGKIMMSQLIDTGDQQIVEMRTELAAQRCRLTIMATAKQTRPCQAECDLYIDETGSLRLYRAGHKRLNNHPLA
jgi:hypothetical protein